MEPGIYSPLLLPQTTALRPSGPVPENGHAIQQVSAFLGVPPSNNFRLSMSELHRSSLDIELTVPSGNSTPLPLNSQRPEDPASKLESSSTPDTSPDDGQNDESEVQNASQFIAEPAPAPQHEKEDTEVPPVLDASDASSSNTDLSDSNSSHAADDAAIDPADSELKHRSADETMADTVPRKSDGERSSQSLVNSESNSDQLTPQALEQEPTTKDTTARTPNYHKPIADNTQSSLNSSGPAQELSTDGDMLATSTDSLLIDGSTPREKFGPLVAGQDSKEDSRAARGAAGRRSRAGRWFEKPASRQLSQDKAGPQSSFYGKQDAIDPRGQDANVGQVLNQPSESPANNGSSSPDYLHLKNAEPSNPSAPRSSMDVSDSVSIHSDYQANNPVSNRGQAVPVEGQIATSLSLQLGSAEVDAPRNYDVLMQSDRIVANQHSRPGAGGVGGTADSTAGDPAADATRTERLKLIQRVARSFSRLGPTGGSVHLRLHPPELGSLAMQVRIEGRTMTAHLTTESAAAREVILDSLPQLRARLSQQGYEVTQITVDVDLQDQSASDHQHRGSDNLDWTHQDRQAAYGRREMPLDLRRAAHLRREMDTAAKAMDGVRLALPGNPRGIDLHA